MKPKVLFICVHNSARSQMAESWLNHRCGEFFEAQSAGLEPGTLNPLAVEVMQEIGIKCRYNKLDTCQRNAIHFASRTDSDEAKRAAPPVGRQWFEPAT